MARTCPGLWRNDRGQIGSSGTAAPPSPCPLPQAGEGSEESAPPGPSPACGRRQGEGRAAPRCWRHSMDDLERALVSAEQVERFARDGFVVIERLLPQDVVAAVRARFEPLFA